MRHLFHHLRARAAAQTVATTTFCEECGGVCTPEDRRDALRDRQRDTIQRAALYHV